MKPKILLTLITVIIVIIAFWFFSERMKTIKWAKAIAREAVAEIYVAKLDAALRSYAAQFNNPPTTQQGLAALVAKPTVEPIPPKWIKFDGIGEKIERDPWGMDYHYEYPGKHNQRGFDIFSSGPDRTPGTEDDIGNW